MYVCTVKFDYAILTGSVTCEYGCENKNFRCRDQFADAVDFVSKLTL